MPASLVHFVLRHDTLIDLARFTARMPAYGRRRTVNYRALANEECRAAHPHLPPTTDPARMAALTAARLDAARLVGLVRVAEQIALQSRTRTVNAAVDPGEAA